MASEQPHILPRTVGSRGGGCSDRAVPWGTVRSRGAPTRNGAGCRALGWEGSRGCRPGVGGGREWRPC